MYKIAIVEDNVADAATIEANIENYFNLNGGSPVDVDKFTDGLFFIENYRPDYDIVMLDIQMPLLDGMRPAAKLREIDESMSLVFITNMAQFAIQGYEVNACGYLLKPIKYGDIEFLLKRLIPQIMRRRSREIVLRYNGVIKKIDVTDLYYVEVNAHDDAFSFEIDVAKCFLIHDISPSIGLTCSCKKGGRPITTRPFRELHSDVITWR